MPQVYTQLPIIKGEVIIPPNFAQQTVAGGIGDLTLTAADTTGGSNFSSLTVINPTASDCTVTLGTANTVTLTVQAETTLSLDCVVSKIVLHATAAKQQVIALQYNPATT